MTHCDTNLEKQLFNTLNAQLNPICHLLALLDHHILHVSRIRVKILDACVSILRNQVTLLTALPAGFCTLFMVRC